MPKSRPTPASPAVSRSRSRTVALAAAAALLAAVFLVYGQVAGFDFVNYDDPDYVALNPHVRDGLSRAGVVWALRSGEFANWFPVTRLSHLLVAQAFALDPGCHHLANVLLHGLAAIALFAFLRRATAAVAPSLFVAFVFALHPLHVESVAWISERKDVLSALFWFLSLWAYAGWARRPTRARYAAALAFFALGLMSKPMVVTLPFVLLLLDLWPLRRPRTAALLVEKIPFFALSAAASLATFLVQKNAGALRDYALPLRLENAAVSYWAYLWRTVWPTHLAVFYPYPAHIPIAAAVLALLALAAVSIAVWRALPSRPWLAVGWFWFLGTLVPVIGLVQVGDQARADRYMYLPLTGLSILLAWSVPPSRWTRPAAVSALAALAAVAWAQTSYWRNDETLFGRALAVTPDNYLAHLNLGVRFSQDRARLAEGIAHLETALRLQPALPRVHTDLGNAFMNAGRVADAAREYEAGVRAQPASAIARNNLGNALSQLPGRLPEAIAQYRAALRLEPNFAIHNNLGNALARTPGQLAEAVREFEAALRLNPDFAPARVSLEQARAALEKESSPQPSSR